MYRGCIASNKTWFFVSLRSIWRYRADQTLKVLSRAVFADESVHLHYWRTKAKEEVDLVIATPDRLLPIEIKSDKRIQARHLRGLRRFLDKEKERTGILMGRFDDVDLIEEAGTRIYLLPFWML